MGICTLGRDELLGGNKTYFTGDFYIIGGVNNFNGVYRVKRFYENFMLGSSIYCGERRDFFRGTLIATNMNDLARMTKRRTFLSPRAINSQDQICLIISP